jgi:hypothetical protein
MAGKLAPLHASAEGAFGAVVGGLNAVVFQKSKEAVVVFEESRSEIADLAVRTVQVSLRQCKNLLLNRERSQQQLVSIDLTAAEFVPQPE